MNATCAYCLLEIKKSWEKKKEIKLEKKNLI